MSGKLPRYILPLLVMYIANSIKGMDRLKELVLRIQSSIPELSNYFEKLYTNTTTSPSIHPELCDDIQLLHMWKYIEILGTISKPEKMLFMVTDRGRLFVESTVLHQLPFDIYAKIKRIVITCLGLKKCFVKAVKRFVTDADYCVTTDCILAVLSSALLELRDIALSMGFSEEILARKFLNHPKVVKILARLTDDIDALRKSIERDERFENLRPYASMIVRAVDRVARGYEDKKVHREVARHKATHFEDYGRAIKTSLSYDKLATRGFEGKEEVSRRFGGRKHGVKLLFGITAIIVITLLVIVSPFPPAFYHQLMKMFSSTPTSKTLFTYGKIVATTTLTRMSSRTRSSTETSVAIPITTRTVVATLTISKYTTRITTTLNSTPHPHTVSTLTSHCHRIPQYTSITSRVATLSKVVNLLTPLQKGYKMRKYLEFSTLRIYINSTHLVVEEFWNEGTKRYNYPYLVVEKGEYRLHLVPYPLSSDTPHVVATYVFVNKTYAKAVFPISKILKALRKTNSSVFEIELYDVDKECQLYIDWKKGTIGFGDCEDVIYIFLPSFGNTFYDVILKSFNETTMSYLRKLVYNNTIPRDTEEAVWRALEWVDENTKYDYGKALFSIFSEIYDPITFVKKGGGVCADYAVFLAATLLSAGIEPVYILEFNTTRGLHATVAVELNNTLFVLDQHLPVMEWDDYLEYVFNVTGPVYVYRIWYNPRIGPVIEFYRLSKSYPDTYPRDAVPPRFARDVCKKLAELLSASCTPTCKLGWVWRLRWSWEALKFYSPLFHEQWVNFIARKLALYLRYHPSCIWIEVSNPLTLVIYYR